jgi:hypothetical protein
MLLSPHWSLNHACLFAGLLVVFASTYFAVDKDEDKAKTNEVAVK